MLRNRWRKSRQDPKPEPVTPLVADADSPMAVLSTVAKAFQLSAHVLVRHGDQLTGQMVGRLSGIESPAIQNIIQRGIAGKKGPWLRPLTPSLVSSREPLVRTLSGHQDWVRRVAISPDGKTIVSGSTDRTVKIWDLISGRERYSIELLTQADYLERNKRIESVTVIPRGAQVVKGGRIVARVGQATRFIDLESGLEDTNIVDRTIAKLKDDGTRALLKSDGNYQLWDLVHDRKLLTLQGEGIEQILVNPLWTHALLKVKGVYQVWDLCRNELLSTLKEEAFADANFMVTPYGIFMAKQKGVKVEIWDLKRGRKRRTLNGHTGDLANHTITGLAITPDGSRVISGSYDNTLKVWDLKNNRELLSLEGPSGSVAVTPDGTYILSWSLKSDPIKIWNLEQGVEIPALSGHAGGVSDGKFSPDGTRFVTAGYDGTLKVWDLTNLEERHTHRRYAGPVRGVAISPDGTRVIPGFKDGSIGVWDLDKREELFALQCQEDLMSIAVTPDGTRVVAGLWESIEIWDLDNRQRLFANRWAQDGLAPQDFTGKIAITPDGDRLLACCSSAIHMWDPARGKKIGILGVHEARVYDLVVMQDGCTLVSCSEDATLRFWDIARKEEIHRLNWFGAITALALTPDGTRLITGGGTPDRSDGKRDYVIRVVDLESGKQVAALEGHTAKINALAVSPDGLRVVSSAADSTLRVWELARRKEIARFVGEGDMLSCAVTPDGSCILAGDAEGRLHFLKLENVSPAVPGVLPSY